MPRARQAAQQRLDQEAVQQRTDQIVADQRAIQNLAFVVSQRVGAMTACTLQVSGHSATLTFVGQDAQSTLSVCAHWICQAESSWGIWEPVASEPARDQLVCVTPVAAGPDAASS